MSLVNKEDLLKLYKGADEEMQSKISRAVDLVEKTLSANDVLAEFDVGKDLILGDLVPTGKDIKEHLKGCFKVFIGVCTLGVEIDKLIERLKITDLSTAYLVDIAASFAVENYTERVWQGIKENAEKHGKRCTTRYSCGYGDFDLSQQKDILKVSGADKRLFINVNEGGMMYPTKTITFLCGIKENDEI